MAEQNMAPNSDDKSALAPEQCQTMEDVRLGVDTLDQTLVELLTIRQGYMEAAARIKPAASDVRVPWRVEQVVENVLLEASKTGLSPRIAEPVWRVLIEQCILYEGKVWQNLRKNADKKGDAEQSASA